MNKVETVDEKIKHKLQELREATKNASKYTARDVSERLESGELKPMDIFDMAGAFETEILRYIEFRLLLAEKFPERFRVEEKKILQKERKTLQERIKAWKERRFPD